MIQKQRVGRGFRGLLDYLFRESQELQHDTARIVATNMAARTPRGLAAEFGAFRALNPHLQRAVYHCALRLPAGERLTDERWASFARDYLAGMGFAGVPYVAVAHADGHIHLVASRVRPDGGTVSDRGDHWRSNRLVYALEERYGLTHAVDARRERSPVHQPACDEAEQELAREPPAPDDGVGKEKTHRAGAGRERRWDMATPESRREEQPAAARWIGRDLDEVIPRAEAEAMFARARRWDLDAGGRFDARSAAINVWSATADPEPIATIYVSWRTPTPDRVTIRRVEWDAARPEAAAELARAFDVLRGQWRPEPGQDQRAVAPRPAPWDPERPELDPERWPTDRTLAAVFTQLVAMGCDRYEVGLRTPEKGMLLRTWDHGGVLEALPWLKAMNARGHDIYIRPAGSSGLVLVDDLSAQALDRLRLAGLPPAAVVETSPGNHQAWLRLSRQPMPPELATAAARELAERFGGDPNAADWRHFGRLAGFTNRKPEHTRPDGLQPYVRILEAKGREAPLADRLIERAQERLAARREPLAREASAAEEPTPEHPARPGEERLASRLGAEYRRRAERLMARFADPDESRVDWMVCRQLAERYPEAGPEVLGRAMREGSPRLHERKGRHADDYVQRTVRKALRDPELRREREHGEDRGR